MKTTLSTVKSLTKDISNRLTYRRIQPGLYMAYFPHGDVAGTITRVTSHKWRVVTWHGRLYDYPTFLECKIYLNAVSVYC